MFEPPERMQAIRDTGRPRGPRWRHVRPPVRVSLDLGALFAVPPHLPHRRVPDGLRLRRVLEGRLTMWALSEEGDWFGLVVYEAAAADGSTGATISHWVPAHVVLPVDGARGRRPGPGRT
ncbi:hypothetical protein RHODO2019_09240 [Rhodococcus antarcticus]|uniref:Uncharacterized protein n=1 Tax=Rhodococcus antarcticus TaxID=2987751 RepID=A0ABY6NVL1_9NOCA|nr:hypothetical protein [Rhodococcus antarcticus]UZJ23424.1 hypothetical protein RHODO2019_09240 [Rhodococcus antarcticus]